MPKQPFTEAKARANERWRERNKERKKYVSYRSGARGFAKIAELNDAIEMRDEFAKRVKELKKLLWLDGLKQKARLF